MMANLTLPPELPAPCLSRRWDLNTGLCAAIFVGNNRAVFGLCVDSGNAWLYAAGGDRTVRRYPLYASHETKAAGEQRDLQDPELLLQATSQPALKLKYMCL